MNLENLRMLEEAVEHLAPVLDEVVFVGGATVELWITDETAPEFRATADVDVVVEITSRRDYYRFEKRLRAIGFENDMAGGVICRFSHRVSLIDGRGELKGEVARAPISVQRYMAAELEKLSAHRDFDRGLEGALLSSPETRERVDLVIWPRVNELIALGSDRVGLS